MFLHLHDSPVFPLYMFSLFFSHGMVVVVVCEYEYSTVLGATSYLVGGVPCSAQETL